MKKVWVIKIPNGEYLENQPKGGTNVWAYSSKAKTTTDITKAKHYTTEGRAKGVMNSQAKQARGFAIRNKEYSKSNRKFFFGLGLKAQVEKDNTHDEKYNIGADWIDSFTYHEVEVEFPNNHLNPVTELKFAKYDKGFSTKKSQGNCHCKGCGIYFHNIPILVFGKRKVSRICPLCIIERAEEASKLLEAMEESQRENYEAERFIERMG
tara:strand:+ start:121 stop:747 length:627 start_codon:yes stop_codon:yes gene_type:complete